MTTGGDTATASASARPRNGVLEILANAAMSGIGTRGRTRSGAAVAGSRGCGEVSGQQRAVSGQKLGDAGQGLVGVAKGLADRAPYYRPEDLLVLLQHSGARRTLAGSAALTGCAVLLSVVAV